MLTVLPDPVDALADTLLSILFGTSQAWQSARLRPLLVGRPHPKRQLTRWKRPGIVKISLRFHAAH